MARLACADLALGPAFVLVTLAALILIVLVVVLAIVATVLIVRHLRKRSTGKDDGSRDGRPIPPDA